MTPLLRPSTLLFTAVLAAGLPLSAQAQARFPGGTIGFARADGTADGVPTEVPAYGPVAPVSALAPVTLTHSASQTIAPLNSISCNLDGIHTENSYYRVFDLPAFGITTAFTIAEVEIGVEEAITGTGADQPLSVKLYTLAGPFVLANLTPIGQADSTVADQSGTILTIPVTGVAPAGSTLVVEVLTPDGTTAGHSFFIGSNTEPETSPSYIRAPATGCAITEPTPIATVGYPDMHIVLNVTGDDGTVGTEHTVPGVFALGAAYPNPFGGSAAAPTTRFALSLVQPQAVRVAVVDVLGREVRTLHDGLLGRGETTFAFDATGLPSGRYLLRVTGETFASTRSVTLLK